MGGKLYDLKFNKQFKNIFHNGDLNRIYLNFSVGIFSEKEKKSLLYRLLVMNC